MRIFFENGPKGTRSYTIDLDGTENANFKNVLEAWLDALEFHELKSRDYDERGNEGDHVWDLGLKGEWPGVTRKIQKLHKIIWKGKDVLFEGGQEIMMDLMGALGLMLLEQKRISDKYNASWRINSGNKPTFGPGQHASSTLKPDSWLAAPKGIDPLSAIEKCMQYADGVHRPMGRPGYCTCGYGPLP